MAMLTEAQNVPKTGERIVPQKGPGDRDWRKPAIVTRVECLPGGLHRVAAEFSDTAQRAARFKREGKPDRRGENRGSADRRRSSRWLTDKMLPWRVSRGRRIRESQLLERSLDGLVLAVEPGDAPPEGTRLFPYGAEPIDRCGFRSAIVRRTEVANDDHKLVFAEIES
jgi:hypothetical protein